MKKDVLQKKLKDEAPKPLSLAMAELIEKRKEGLRVNDLLYIVHYPKEQKYVRCANSEVLRVLKGKTANHKLAILKHNMCYSHFITGPYMGHVATTDIGSSGSPILREYHNRWVVVGLHRGSKFGSVNIATLMTVIVDDIQGIAYTGTGIHHHIVTIITITYNIQLPPPHAITTYKNHHIAQSANRVFTPVAGRKTLTV